MYTRAGVAPRRVAIAAVATLVTVSGVVVSTPTAVSALPGTADAAAIAAGDVSAPVGTVVQGRDLDPTTCLTTVPDVDAGYLSRVPADTSQLIIARGDGMRSADNQFERWQRNGSCWTLLSSDWSYNGAKGWHVRPWSGSLRSPIGVFSITDAGGRLPNPGTTLHYHYGPGRYERGGYKIDYPVQLYNYVVAINYNRRIGKPPRDERQPDLTTGSGYWIHQRGLGVTRGCLSLTKSQLRQTVSWLRADQRPYIIMGPQKLIGTKVAATP